MLRWLLRKPRLRRNLLLVGQRRGWLPRRFELHRGRKLNGLLLLRRLNGRRHGLWRQRPSVRPPLVRRLR